MVFWQYFLYILLTRVVVTICLDNIAFKKSPRRLSEARGRVTSLIEVEEALVQFVRVLNSVAVGGVTDTDVTLTFIPSLGCAWNIPKRRDPMISVPTTSGGVKSTSYVNTNTRINQVNIWTELTIINIKTISFKFLIN